MTLNVKERLTLLNILPAEGDILTLRVVHKMRKAISFSEDDLKKFSLRVEGNQVQWNEKADVPAEVEITPKATEIIRKTLEERSAQKKLREEEVELYDKFVPSE